FQGETLAQQLIRGGGNDAIREGLATLLHQDKWEEAIATVDQVRRKLSSELTNLAAADREYKSKSSDLEQIRKLIREAKAEIEDWEKEENEAQEEFDAAEDQIKALGTGEAHKAVTNELNRKRHDLKTAENRFTQLNAQLAATVADSKGTPFYQSA